MGDCQILVSTNLQLGNVRLILGEACGPHKTNVNLRLLLVLKTCVCIH